MMRHLYDEKERLYSNRTHSGLEVVIFFSFHDSSQNAVERNKLGFFRHAIYELLNAYECESQDLMALVAGHMNLEKSDI
jgi:hypothetical protein